MQAKDKVMSESDALTYRFKKLVDEMRTYGSGPITFTHFRTSENPKNLIRRIRESSFGPLLLPLGASMAIPGPHDYYPDLHAYANDEELDTVSLTAHAWDWEKYPDRDNATWTRGFEISLWYKTNVKQSINFQISEEELTPSVLRTIFASEYYETGYEGHDRQYRKIKGFKEYESALILMEDLWHKAIKEKDKTWEHIKSISDRLEKGDTKKVT